MTSPSLVDTALAGCTIVIAADRRASDLASSLERRGARVQRAPALSIVRNADDEELVARTRELITNPPDIVVVTTGVGFRGWMDAAHENDLAEALSQALHTAIFVARGPKAHGAIQQAGFVADWVAESETSAEVGEYLRTTALAGKRVVVQHHGAGSDGLDAELSAAGAVVVKLTVYRWGPPEDPQLVRRTIMQAAAGDADAVLFTSAPGAAAWVRTAEQLGTVDEIRSRAAYGRLLLAAVGPITASPLRDANLATAVASRGRLGSLARCVIAHFGVGGKARTLPTAAGELSVRSGGVVIGGELTPLSRTGASVFGSLFDAAGGVLSRDEIARGMPGTATNPHAVEMAVARVREALGGIDVIQTVVKRGYRLAVETRR